MLAITRKRKEFFALGSVELRERIVLHVLVVELLVECETQEVRALYLVVLSIHEEVLHWKRIVDKRALRVHLFHATVAIEILFWVNQEFLFQILELVFIEPLINFEVHFLSSQHIRRKEVCSLDTNFVVILSDNF